MKKEYMQKAYMPVGDQLDIRVRNTLNVLEEAPVRRITLHSIAVFAACMIVLLASTAALAAGILRAERVDVAEVADAALYEEYGITDAMQVYFDRRVQQHDDGSATVIYTGAMDFAYVLGTYTVNVQRGEADAVWSRDGESIEGGLNADAWGAPQLAIALDTVRKTYSFGDVYTKAVEHALAAGETLWSDPSPDDPRVQAPEGYQSWSHYYRAQAMPRMAIAPKDAIESAREAIAARYKLTKEQMEKLQLHDLWTDFGVVDDIPVLDVWFWLSMDEGNWQEGDGLYGASVNVETGVIEEIRYDSALAGNG